MRTCFFTIATCFLCVSLARGQEKQTKYTNAELGIEFSGVYGWETRMAPGAGAWTELASYTFQQYGATVRLLARTNPYETFPEMRAAIEKEYAADQPPKPGEPVYKEVSVNEKQMSRGNKLPGVQVNCYSETVEKDGKKRERILRVRTYFGQARLYRVECVAWKAREKRVGDSFDAALDGLVVSGKDEKVVRGIPVRSDRGRYSCLVPDGFIVVVPAPSSNSDVKFEDRRRGITVTVFAYYFRGDNRDHLGQVEEFFGTDLKVDQEETQVLGGDGFVCTLTKDNETTLITGTVRNDHAYRVHTTAGSKDVLEDARRVHAAFLATLQVGR